MSDSALVKNKEASITTTGIDIKCLRVDGRNLTMSVFRQIPKECPFDADGDIKGDIWGWVNYFWGDESGDLHLVWQKDDRLYRFPMRGKITYIDKDEGYMINGKPYTFTASDYPPLDHALFELEDSKEEGKRKWIEQDKKKVDRLKEKYRSILRDIKNKGQLYIAT